jgi:3-oxoacyl-[acyl-carrier-protein] synthase II
LEYPDPVAPISITIMGGGRNIDAEYVMSNNFAFGGINTSLVFSRWKT